MVLELRKYIEDNIQLIDDNRLEQVYLDCPLHLLADLHNTLLSIDSMIPYHLVPYVNTAIYIADKFRAKGVHRTLLSVNEDSEEYTFETANVLCDFVKVRNDLYQLLPNNFTDVTFEQSWWGTLSIKVIVKPNYITYEGREFTDGCLCKNYKGFD